MARGCCSSVGLSSGGRLYFIDALGYPEDANGDPVTPADAVQLRRDGVVYVLQPGDVFLALIEGADDGDAATTLWVALAT